MVRNVIGDLREQPFERPSLLVIAIAIGTASLESLTRKGSKDASQLPAGDFNHGELFFDVAILVNEGFWQEIGLEAKKAGIVVRDHALHAFSVNRLEIRNVA